jgi:hypothetical protein
VPFTTADRIVSFFRHMIRLPNNKHIDEWPN